MKLTITGAGGMLGNDLANVAAQAGYEVVSLPRATCDIASAEDVDAIQKTDLLINCAAYTQVDLAESHKEVAFRINAAGPALLAARARVLGCPLLHVSTDYVFNGDSKRAWNESDRPDPLGVYGASKLAGEQAVQAAGGRYLIVRTQSLFGVGGNNFVRTMVRLSRESDQPLKVVHDQVCSPTWTRDLARGLIKLIECRAEGIVHVSASGSCSWFDFASEIMRQTGSDKEVLPVSSEDFSRPAPRPANSCFNLSRFEELTQWNMPAWQEALSEYLALEGWRN